MAEPVTIFAFLNSAIKFSEYAVKLCAVGSENGVFVRLILRVRNDLEEVERLISTPSVKKTLISTPGKLLYIKDVILSTKTALNEIGRWVDRVRTDKEAYGSISMENRIRWVFNDKDKLAVRTLELNTNHQSLSNVLSYLMPLEKDEIINTSEDAPPPNYHDATCLDEILPMSSRQRRQALYRHSEIVVEKPKEANLHPDFQQTAQQQLSPSPYFQTSFQKETKSTYSSWASSEPKLREAKSSVSLAKSHQDARLQHHTPTPTTAFHIPSNKHSSSLYVSKAQYPPNSSEPFFSIPRQAVPNQLAMSAISQPTTSPSMTPVPSTEVSFNLAPVIKQQNPPGISSPTFDQMRANSSQPAPIGESLRISDREWLSSQSSLRDQGPWAMESQTSQVSIGLAHVAPNTTQTSFAPVKSTALQYTSENAKPMSQQFSATNYIGPVNAYDMFTEMETPLLDSPTPKFDLHTNHAPQTTATADHPHNTGHFSSPAKSFHVQRKPQHDQAVNIAELVGNLSLHQPEERKSLTELPVETTYFHTTSGNELSNDNSAFTSPCRQKIPSGCAEMPAGEAHRTVTWPFASVNISADAQDTSKYPLAPSPRLYTSSSVAFDPMSCAMELPSQVPSMTMSPAQFELETHVQDKFQYPYHTTQPQTYTQPEIQTTCGPIYPNQHQNNFQGQSPPQPQYSSQPMYSQQPPHLSQTQPQPYRQQSTPYIPPPSPMNTYAPTPVPWPEHHQPYRDAVPVSPPTQPATPAQNFGSIESQQEPLSNVVSLGEARRRNQRALLNVL